MTFDSATRTFFFSNNNSLSLSGTTFKDYMITMTGQSGNIKPVKGYASFNLRIKNPCINSDYVIVTKALLLNQEYELYNFAPTGL